MSDSCHPDPSIQFFIRWILYSALGIMVLSANPFGINDKTDKASQDAIYKVIAPLYESKAQGDIVVVLVDDNAITELSDNGLIAANEWPLLYKDHANLLSRIARYSAKAVFVDVYFKKKRSTDSTFDQFLRRIKYHQEKYGTQFLFAGGYADETLSGLQQELSLAAALSVNGWGGYDNAYPLKDKGKRSQNKGKYSAAYDLYHIACLEEKPLKSCSKSALLASQIENGDALSVRWGSQPAAPIFPEFIKDECQAEKSGVFNMFSQIVEAIVTGIINYDGADHGQVRCPYQQVLLADTLMYVDKHGTSDQKVRLGHILRDKIVFYGVALEGLHDTVISPVHGALPGVMFHAMALDNLMAYGDRYIRAGDDFIDIYSYLAWTMLVFAIVSMLFWMEKRSTQASTAEGLAQKKLADRLHHAARLRWPVNMAGLVIVILLSLTQFVYMRHEPLNSLGFLALTGLVSQLVHNDFSSRFYVWLINVPAYFKKYL